MLVDGRFHKRHAPNFIQRLAVCHDYGYANLAFPRIPNPRSKFSLKKIRKSTLSSFAGNHIIRLRLAWYGIVHAFSNSRMPMQSCLESQFVENCRYAQGRGHFILHAPPERNEKWTR